MLAGVAVCGRNGPSFSEWKLSLSVLFAGLILGYSVKMLPWGNPLPGMG